MLDPNSATRATIKEILAHPWMTVSKTSHSPARRQRKTNMCYSRSEANDITRKLIGLHECECSCHSENIEKYHRDSVITKHCSDCDDIVANDESENLHQMNRSTSNCSSGYGSESGSTLFTPRVSQVSLTDPFRKSSLHTLSQPKRVEPIGSVTPCGKPIIQDDEEDLVFVWTHYDNKLQLDSQSQVLYSVITYTTSLYHICPEESLHHIFLNPWQLPSSVLLLFVLFVNLCLYSIINAGYKNYPSKKTWRKKKFSTRNSHCQL